MLSQSLCTPYQVVTLCAGAMSYMTRNPPRRLPRPESDDGLDDALEAVEEEEDSVLLEEDVPADWTCC